MSGGEPGPLLLCGRVSSQLTLQYLPGAGPLAEPVAATPGAHRGLLISPGVPPRVL